MSIENLNASACPAAGPEGDPELCRLCRKALTRLDNALELQPQELLDEVDIAENAVAGLRDLLIERYRHARDPSYAAEVRRLLDRANVALSLIAGVVYPSARIERSGVKEAYKALKEATGPCAEVPV